MSSVKIRKKPKEKLTDTERLQIVDRYMTSDQTSRQIAEEFNTTEKNVDLVISRHWKTLTNVRETKLMTHQQMSEMSHKNGSYMALKAIGNRDNINKEFLSLLSGPEDHLLTDNELQYCYNFVATGDNLKALESADLHRGLMTAGSDKSRNQYRLSCQLRGHFLRQKPNIAKYILRLKEEQFIPEIVDKQFIQRELLETLHHQKEGGVSAKEKLRTIELLGKTVGAFSEVIKVEEVDPAKALDYIDSLAQVEEKISRDITEE